MTDIAKIRTGKVKGTMNSNNLRIIIITILLWKGFGSGFRKFFRTHIA